ncbi:MULTISPECIES: hypothetical protein [Calothrix]|uniref:Uncharacterized protein n=2 Tax=Calothrix TaxID=1186 RepID=A0ABR8AJN4_9CYAN|nr:MULTISPECIES: hypothetical protein [Calothrix]MBD2200176.1 hypothetical protein [Calothrix parietina FACHB-288]MBD2229169.1 hypothetical protein [Calothrix anomala FACHB-343]
MSDQSKSKKGSFMAAALEQKSMHYHPDFSQYLEIGIFPDFSNPNF